MVLLQCLKQLVRKTKYNGKILFEQDLVSDSFVDHHLILNYFTSEIWKRSCSIRCSSITVESTISCAKKPFFSCSFFQKMFQYIPNWSKTFFESFCLRKDSIVNVLNWVESYSESYISNFSLESLIVIIKQIRTWCSPTRGSET